MSDKIRVGIIGTSKFTEEAHIAGFKNNPDAELVAICGRHNEKRLRELSDRYGIPFTFLNYEALFESGLDAVVIASPNYLHYPMTMKALQYNLHILCEKPLATSLEDAKQMYQKAEEKSIIHMVSFTFRYTKPFQDAKNILEKNLLGELFHFNAHFLADFDVNGYHTWRFDKSKAGYGALGDLAPHIIDIGRWFIGDIKKVCGLSNTFVKHRKLYEEEGYGEVDVDDSTVFIAEFKNGVQGVFQTSMVATGRDGLMRIEISGRKGSIIIVREHGLISLYKISSDGKSILVSQSREDRERIFTEMARDFTNCINNKSQCITNTERRNPTFYDGLKVQEVIEAADQSIKQKQWKYLSNNYSEKVNY